MGEMCFLRRERADLADFYFGRISKLSRASGYGRKRRREDDFEGMAVSKTYMVNEEGGSSSTDCPCWLVII